MTTGFQKLIHKNCLYVLLLFCSFSYSQSFLISYPTLPENASACNDATLLTVRMNVTQASSSGATVTIDLADGMEYELGSVTKTGGTPALSIVESGGTLNQPQFTLAPSNLAIGNFIEFTILRRAVCEAYDNILLGTVFKDRVMGEINGVQTDEESTPYTVKYPSLTFVQPPTVNNALIGETHSRNFNITNGADGCANAVHFSIDYNGGGITPQSLTLGATTINPTSVVGSTYYYTISGALLTADGQLCNGESLNFTETVLINTCSPATDYNIGWGCAADPAAWCTNMSGTGTVNMATGTPEFISNRNTKIGYVDMCTPFQVETEFENAGSGHSSAATMYNIKLRKGRGSGSINLVAMNSKYSISNVTLNAQNVPWTFAGGILTVTLEDYFTADPDGVGVGLDDIDGDGFYDDLPKDSKVEILMDASIDCSRTCGQSTIMDNFAGAIDYTTMCSSTVTKTNRIYATGSSLGLTRSSFVTNGYLPPNIENNIPFRTRLSVGYYRWLDDFDGTNSRWVYDLTLPPGVSVAGTGNVVWQRGEYPAKSGAPVATTYTQTGNVVTITSPDAAIGYASIDLVYDCSSGSAISLDYNFRKVNNIVTGCECQDEFACGSLSANASCPGGCALGPSSEIPIVRRADNSLGWTNSSMTTKQLASNISAYDLSKAIYLDEIEVHGDATQNGNTTTLGARLTLPKVNATTNKLTPLEIEVVITRGASTIGSGTLTSFSMVNSTSTDQIIDWSLDSLIPVGGLQSGDEISTISRYQVTSNAMTQHDVQSGGQWFFYNTDPIDSSLIYCNLFTPEMYLVGTRRLIGTNSYRTYGCNINSLGNNTNYLARRFDASGFNYNSEYRPVIYVEEIEAIIPEGYEFIQASISGGGVITPDHISGNTYTFINPGTWPGVGLTVTNSYGRLYPFQVRATCDTETSEQIRFNFQIKDYYYHYAENDPNNTDYDTTISNIRNIAHYDHPEIDLDNQTGNIQASKPIESWVVRMSNPTNETAPYNWISIDDVSNVQIERVVDVATGLDVAPTPYPGGNLYQLGTTGLDSGQFKDYRIEFSYTSCLQTTVKVFGGWNCGSYPTDPNLETCSKEELDLVFTPSGGEVEIISVHEPSTAIDICTPLDYEFHINSAQSGNIKDNDFTIIAPQGMNPIAGTIEAEYPVGSGNWEALALNSNVGSSYNYILTSHSNYPANGLPGTLNDGGDANNRLMAVRFQMTSGCDFIAGSNFQVSAAANNICGTPAIGSSLESQTVSTNVAGVTIDYSVLSSMNVLSGDFNNCGTPVVLESTQTIITPSPIGANGIIEIELPDGYLYTASSYICTSTLCATFESVSTNANGREIIRLSLPTGMDNGDSVSYTISIFEDSTEFISCGNKTIEISAQDETENISCATEASGFCPILSVQTGSYNFDFSVDRASIDFTSTTTTSTFSGSNESITTSFEIENTSLYDIASGATIEVFYDANQNGVYDAPETILNSKSLTSGITAGSTISETLGFTIPASQVCDVIIGLRTSENYCFCTDSFTPMAIPTSLNGAAGTDKEVCEINSSVALGNPMAGYSYQWAGASPVETAYLDNTLSSNPNFTYGGPKITSAVDLLYTVTVTRPDGCKSTDTMTVTVNPSPAATILITDASCGQNNGSIRFSFDDYPQETHIEFSLNNSATFESQVLDTSGNVTYNNLAPGNYQLWARWGDDSCPVDLGNHTINSTPVVSFSTHPAITTIVVGNDAQFSATVQNANTYQWQVSTDGGASFSDITDGMEYSGAQTSTLTVIKPEPNKNNFLYRLNASNSNTPLCSISTSNSALLLIRVARVITNRRITHRVKKN